jgi:8-oxo-dGTP pyrophosphatase MutT (NUDIX family)
MARLVSMMKDTNQVTKIWIIVVDQEGERWALLSIKRAADKRKHRKLEMLGGHLDQKESPLEALIRELGEEERTGYLSERVGVLEPQPLKLEAGGAVHHLFEIEISEQEFKRLQYDPKESLGFELIRISELKDGEHWDRLTWRTQRILRTLAPREMGEP